MTITQYLSAHHFSTDESSGDYGNSCMLGSLTTNSICRCDVPCTRQTPYSIISRHTSIRSASHTANNMSTHFFSSFLRTRQPPSTHDSRYPSPMNTQTFPESAKNKIHENHMLVYLACRPTDCLQLQRFSKSHSIMQSAE